MIKPTNSLILILHPFNKIGIKRVNKGLIRHLKTNYVFIIIAIILIIPLELGYYTEKTLQSVVQQVDACCGTVPPMILYCADILIYECGDNKGTPHVVGHDTGLYQFNFIQIPNVLRFFG